MRPPFLLQAVWLLMETWVRLFVLTPAFEGGRRLEHSLIWGMAHCVRGVAATGRVVLFWAGVGALILA